MNNQEYLGKEIVIDIKKLGINGEGIGYFNNIIVFVPFTLCNEKVKVIIIETYNNRLVGKLNEVLIKSPKRVDPFCPVFLKCGACTIEHIDYNEALVQKRLLVIEAFLKYYSPKIDNNIISNVVPSPLKLNYRNKVKLHIVDNKVGFFKANSNQFISFHSCQIHNTKINQVLKSIEILLEKHHISSFNEKTKTGDIRALTIRVTNLNEVQIVFILRREIKEIKDLAIELANMDASVKSIYEAINSDNYSKNIFELKESFLLVGKASVDEKLDSYQFKIFPDSFFQLNSQAASLFYKAIQDSILDQKQTVLDAYAGMAQISHYLASKVKKVYAVEISKDSVKGAKESLASNNIKNVVVIEGDLVNAIKGLAKSHFDVIVFDPPRIGLKDAINVVLKYLPQRIIYGSCNPVTLAKDLEKLKDLYVVDEIKLFDMFPYTSHVESVALLSLK